MTKPDKTSEDRAETPKLTLLAAASRGLRDEKRRNEDQAWDSFSHGTPRAQHSLRWGRTYARSPFMSKTHEVRREGQFFDAGRRWRVSRRRGRLLARRPRCVAAHIAAACSRTLRTSGKRDAGRTTVGCSPRKRQGALPSI